MVRLVCRVASAYWVENQCFEHFLFQLKLTDDSKILSRELSLQILSEMISEIWLLVSMCENDADLEDDSQVGRTDPTSGD